MIIHNVFIEPITGTPADDFQALYEHIFDLKGAIPGIDDVFAGHNISPENKDHGFSEGFTVIFDTWRSRAAYAHNPVHLAFSEKYIRPIAKRVLVYDMEPGER